MKFVFCLSLCLVALLPTAFSDLPTNQNYGSGLGAPQRRGGKVLDTLTAHSFGTSKRFPPRNVDEMRYADFSKRNFDEIDSAGFNDFSKRNFDEIDNAGFKDYLRKRNFDEIDAAGFNDFSKRADTRAAAVEMARNLRKAKGGDVKEKKNFDEIDNAGFNDFSKRADIRAAVVEMARNLRKAKGGDVKEEKNFDFDEIDNAGFNDFSRLSNDEYYSYKPYGKGYYYQKYNPFSTFPPKHELPGDLAPYYEEYKNMNYQEDTPYNNYYDLEKYNGIPPYYTSNYNGKYDDMLSHNLPNFSLKPRPFYPPYIPIMPTKSFTPSHILSLLNAVNYNKQKNLGGLDSHSTLPYEPTYYRKADSNLDDQKRKGDHQTTDLKTQP